MEAENLEEVKSAYSLRIDHVVEDWDMIRQIWEPQPLACLALERQPRLGIASKQSAHGLERATNDATSQLATRTWQAWRADKQPC